MAPGNLSDSRVWWHICVIPASKIQGEGAVLGGGVSKKPHVSPHIWLLISLIGSLWLASTSVSCADASGVKFWSSHPPAWCLHYRLSVFRGGRERGQEVHTQFEGIGRAFSWLCWRILNVEIRRHFITTVLCGPWPISNSPQSHELLCV